MKARINVLDGFIAVAILSVLLIHEQIGLFIIRSINNEELLINFLLPLIMILIFIILAIFYTRRIELTIIDSFKKRLFKVHNYDFLY
jgi:hypothetical protein